MKRALKYGLSYITNPARLLARPTLPTNLNLPITDNCNSRCIMCDVWKTRTDSEYNVGQLLGILRDPLFRKIQHVGISGGEPTLRRDLPDFVQVILDTLPSLVSMSITSHGFHTERWRQFLPDISARCSAAGVRLTLNLSVDGVGAVHDVVRRIPGGFDRVMATAEMAKAAKVPVQFHSTIVRPNVYDVNNLVQLAKQRGATPQFRQATTIARLGNEQSIKVAELNADERSFFSDFLSSRLLEQNTTNPARRLFYRELASRVVSGGARRAPCFYQNEGVVLSSNGDLHHCSISSEPFGNALEGSSLRHYESAKSKEIRSRIKQTLCPGCVHDQSGAWSPLKVAVEVLRPTRLGRLAIMSKRVFRFATFFALTMLRLPISLMRVRFRRGTPHPRELRRVVLIGAYGGEHVGDAAILGGVIQRLEQRFGITSAVIVSERPDRTAMWARGLSVTAQLSTCTSSSAIIRDEVGRADAVVYAGGPLMEMPEKALQHLWVTTEAVSVGKPFLVEGVGIGPFKTRIVRFIARQLLRLATSIVVRSSADASDPILSTLVPTVRQDPAFDYLASRSDKSRRLRPSATAAIDSVLEVGDSCYVGINLRPLWNKYVSGARSVADLENHFLECVAEAMTNLHAAARKTETDMRFVFIPMNADHYGFSDLEIAGRLSDLMPPSFPFRVLEHELLVDEAIEALSRCTAVIAMRFHAAIFSLSQGIPTIGIDYAAGVGRGKVHSLFVERGLSRSIVNITDLSPTWLAARVSETLPVRSETT